MNQKSGHLAFLAAFLCVPAFVFYDIATRFAAEGVASGSAEENAAMYPRLIAAILLGLLVIQILRTLTEKVEIGPGGARSLSGLWRANRRALMVFGLFLAYLAAFRWFGFAYSTPVFLALTQLALGYRNLLFILLYSAGVSAAVWFAFAKLLNLVLPVGDLFG